MQQFLMPAAQNVKTGQIIKRTDLSGRRYQESERQQAQWIADDLAQDLTRRLRETWVGQVIEYRA